MIQLPYRDIIPQGDSGGETETKIHPMVSSAKEEAANRGPVQYDTETFTKKRPSYKSKWEEEVKEKKRWRRRFIAAGLTLIALMIFEAFGR
jgi:hypothetical protein